MVMLKFGTNRVEAMVYELFFFSFTSVRKQPSHSVCHNNVLQRACTLDCAKHAYSESEANIGEPANKCSVLQSPHIVFLF